MATPNFDGQLTRANVGLAVRSGLVTEEEAQRYWKARYRHCCLSDSNSKKTIRERTAEFAAARELVLQKMNTSQGETLVAVQGEKRRLEAALRGKDEELRALKKRLCGACVAAAGAGGP